MRRKWMYLLSALILLTLTVGCTVTFDSGSWGSYTLSGEVTSADRSEGIPNVRIHFSDTSIPETTDFNGEWSRGFNGGDLTIRAERRGFIFEPDAYRLYDLDRSRYDLDFTVTGFIDDFTYKTGWSEGLEPLGGGGYYYTSNEYQIQVTGANGTILMSEAPVVIARDYKVKARIHFDGGSINDEYGLVFNLVDWDYYYYVFRINPINRTYQLIRVSGIHDPVIDTTFSDAISPSSSNLLQVEQNGNRVYLSVNGTLVDDYNITGDNHSGYNYLSVGLYAWKRGTTTTDCQFDDFELYSAVISDSSMLKASSLNGEASTHKDVEN